MAEAAAAAAGAPPRFIAVYLDVQRAIVEGVREHAWAKRAPAVAAWRARRASATAAAAQAAI
jgi:hypothetical protein